MKATWEVLGEVLRGKRGKSKGPVYRYFNSERRVLQMGLR